MTPEQKERARERARVYVRDYNKRKRDEAKMEPTKQEAVVSAPSRSLPGHEAQTSSDRQLPGRGKRILMTNRNVLSIPGYDPEQGEYVLRFVNDDPESPGNIGHYERAGWEPVHDRTMITSDPQVEVNRGFDATVTRITKSGITKVLMRKRREWEEEDLKTVERRVDRIEEEILGEVDKNGHYGRAEGSFGRRN